MKIQVNNLVKNYDKVKVLKNISFKVDEGCVFGFLGRNGAGKTTTMNILTGLMGYEQGEILYDGKELNSDKQRIMKYIGYLPENPVFYGYMNAYEYMNFIGKISGYDIKGNRLAKRIEELLELVKLKEASKRQIGGYSRGMKQRLGLAVALFNQPGILFLDEPTSALDPEGRSEMIKLLENLKRSGITVFLSTHILSDVERVCDQVCILNKGEIILSSSLDQLKEQYMQPIYDIELSHSSEAVVKSLSGFSWVEKVTSDDRNLSVYIKDMQKGPKELIKALAQSDCTVISCQIRKSNLEDIFIRMVS